MKAIWNDFKGKVESEFTKDGSEGIRMASVRDIPVRQSTHRETGATEVIANLAAGIAHQFNNALVGIAGNIELLKMDLPGDENIEKYIEPMEACVRRMTHLTHQLLAYARGGKYQPKTISLNDFLEESLPIIEHKINPGIQLEVDLSKDISKVRADPAQMQMVLSAVVVNASEALGGQGEIKVITRNEWLEEEFVENHPNLKPGAYVCLAIVDNGKGMDEGTKRRIFEPFFSTKFQGRGLGMAAVYGIVKNHDGGILVDSRLGTGTTVRVYLPASQAEVVEIDERNREEAKMPGDALAGKEEGAAMGG